MIEILIKKQKEKKCVIKKEIMFNNYLECLKEKKKNIKKTKEI